jgi:hypothetical protein
MRAHLRRCSHACGALECCSVQCAHAMGALHSGSQSSIGMLSSSSAITTHSGTPAQQLCYGLDMHAAPHTPLPAPARGAGRRERCSLSASCDVATRSKPPSVRCSGPPSAARPSRMEATSRVVCLASVPVPAACPPRSGPRCRPARTGSGHSTHSMSSSSSKPNARPGGRTRGLANHSSW